VGCLGGFFFGGGGGWGGGGGVLGGGLFFFWGREEKLTPKERAILIIRKKDHRYLPTEERERLIRGRGEKSIRCHFRNKKKKGGGKKKTAKPSKKGKPFFLSIPNREEGGGRDNCMDEGKELISTPAWEPR